jgi:hypothetical protein
MFMPSPSDASELRFELLRTREADPAAEVVGTATFVRGRTAIDAPEAVRAAVQDLLERAFVDRVQADERPRGYRRSGRGAVDLLVPGMPEHFLARLRGLWLSFPDGSVVTARPAPAARQPSLRTPSAPSTPSGGDPLRRRTTLQASRHLTGRGSLVCDSPPEPGLRPAHRAQRTDCGWIT